MCSASADVDSRVCVLAGTLDTVFGGRMGRLKHLRSFRAQRFRNTMSFERFDRRCLDLRQSRVEIVTLTLEPSNLLGGPLQHPLHGYGIVPTPHEFERRMLEFARAQGWRIGHLDDGRSARTAVAVYPRLRAGSARCVRWNHERKFLDLAPDLGQHCKRIIEGLDPNDAQDVGGRFSRFDRVDRHDEDRNALSLRRSRLLSHTTDVADPARSRDRSRDCDPVSAGQLPRSQDIDERKGERKTGRGPADRTRVNRQIERQVGVDRPDRDVGNPDEAAFAARVRMHTKSDHLPAAHSGVDTLELEHHIGAWCTNCEGIEK